MKPDGQPVVEPLVQFRLQIRSPENENCLLYQEGHTRNMTSPNGVFAIPVNDGMATSVNTEPFSLDRVFQNRGTFNFSAGKGAIGSAYAPAVDAGIKLVVEFDGVIGGREMLPDQAINLVPMALETTTVGGTVLRRSCMFMTEVEIRPPFPR